MKRRFVLLLAWETLFPTMGPLPVTSHTRAILDTPINIHGLKKLFTAPLNLTSPNKGAVSLARKESEINLYESQKA
jgi:hypothetical protein